MKFIATKAMRYGTRHLVAGDTFEAKENHGRVYIAMKRAKKAPVPGRPRKVVAEPELPQSVEQAAPAMEAASAPEPVFALAPEPAPKPAVHRPPQPHITHVPTGRKPR